MARQPHTDEKRKKRLTDLHTLIDEHDKKPVQWHQEWSSSQASQTARAKDQQITQGAADAASAETSSAQSNTSLQTDQTRAYGTAARRKHQRKVRFAETEQRAALETASKLDKQNGTDQEYRIREARSAGAATRLTNSQHDTATTRLTRTTRTIKNYQGNTSRHRHDVAGIVTNREITEHQNTTVTSLQREAGTQSRSSGYQENRHQLRTTASQVSTRYPVKQQTRMLGLHERQTQELQAQQQTRTKTDSLNHLSRETRADQLEKNRHKSYSRRTDDRIRSDLRRRQQKQQNLSSHTTGTLRDTEHQQNQSLLAAQQRTQTAEQNQRGRNHRYINSHHQNQTTTLRTTRHAGMQAMQAELKAKQTMANRLNQNENQSLKQQHHKLTTRDHQDLDNSNSKRERFTTMRESDARKNKRREEKAQTKRLSALSKTAAVTTQIQEKAFQSQHDSVLTREQQQTNSSEKANQAAHHSNQAQARSHTHLRVTTLTTRTTARLTQATAKDDNARATINTRQTDSLQREQESAQRQQTLQQTQHSDGMQETRGALKKQRTHVVDHLQQLTHESANLSHQKQVKTTDQASELSQREQNSAHATHKSISTKNQDTLAAARDSKRAQLINKHNRLRTRTRVAENLLASQTGYLQSQEQRSTQQEQDSKERERSRQQERAALALAQATHTQQSRLQTLHERANLSLHASREIDQTQRGDIKRTWTNVLKDDLAAATRANKQRADLTTSRLTELRRRARRKQLHNSDYRGLYYYLDEAGESCRRGAHWLSQKGSAMANAVSDGWHQTGTAIQRNVWSPVKRAFNSVKQTVAESGRSFFNTLKRGVFSVGKTLSQLKKPANQAKHAVKEAWGNTGASVSNSLAGAGQSIQNNTSEPIVADGSRALDTMASGGRSTFNAVKVAGRAGKRGALVYVPHLLKIIYEAASDGVSGIGDGLIALYAVTLKPGKAELTDAMRKIGHHGIVMLGHYLYYRGNAAGTQIKQGARVAWQIASIAGDETYDTLKTVASTSINEIGAGSLKAWHGVSSQMNSAAITVWYGLPSPQRMSHTFKRATLPMVHGAGDMLEGAYYGGKGWGEQIATQSIKGWQVGTYGAKTLGQKTAYGAIYSVRVIGYQADAAGETIAETTDAGLTIIKQVGQVTVEDIGDSAEKLGRIAARTFKAPVRKLEEIGRVVGTAARYAGGEVGDALYFNTAAAGAAVADTAVSAGQTTTHEVQHNAIKLGSGAKQLSSDVQATGASAGAWVYYGVQELAPIGSCLYDGVQFVGEGLADGITFVGNYGQETINTWQLRLQYGWQITGLATHRFGVAAYYAGAETVHTVGEALTKPVEWASSALTTTGEVISDELNQTALSVGAKCQSVSIFTSYHWNTAGTTLSYVGDVVPASIRYGVTDTAVCIVTPVITSVDVVTQEGGKKIRSIGKGVRAVATNVTCFWQSQTPVVTTGITNFGRETAIIAKETAGAVGDGFSNAIIEPAKQSAYSKYLGLCSIWHDANCGVLRARAELEHEKEKVSAPAPSHVGTPTP